MAFSFLPQNYGGLTQMFYPTYHQTPRFGHYDTRFIRKTVSRQPFYPIRPHRPFPVQTRGKHFMPGFPRPIQPVTNFGWPVRTAQFDRRYWKHLNRKQSHYGKSRVNNEPMPYFNTMPTPYSAPYRPRKRFQHDRETRYAPFPVINEQTTSFGGSLNLGNMTEANLNLGNMAEANMSLPPKIRVIFIPTAPPPVPQISIGPLTMPPFLFNRMTDGICPWPIPPPLPQINSLPLSPAVQKLVMDRYANPFAILPFFPPAPVFPPTMPVTCFQAAPQTFVPPPQQVFPDQATVPPPANSNPVPPQVPGNDQSACRACTPAPPQLSIPVNQYHWTQHCSACHCTPSSSFDTNVRPTRGRITPLLGPSVTPDLTIESSRYPHVNSPDIQRPWSSATPPLPEGATIVSDYYLTGNHFQQNWSPNFLGAVYSEKPKRRSRKTIKERPKERKIDRSNSPRKLMRKAGLTPKKLPSIEQSSSSPTWSSRSSPTLASVGGSQPTLVSESSGTNFAGQQVSVVAPRLNFLYKYQPHEFTSVYHTNCDSKSNSRESAVSSTSSPLSKFVSVLNKEYNRKRPPPPLFHFHHTEEKSIRSFTPATTRSRKSSLTSIVVREVTPRPPSATSTLLSDTELLIVAKDFDSRSTTSTLKERKKRPVVHAALSFKDF